MVNNVKIQTYQINVFQIYSKTEVLLKLITERKYISLTIAIVQYNQGLINKKCP